MCGIAGFVGPISEEGALAKVRVLAKALEHRGPDDYGEDVLVSGSHAVALAHRRLSIIDLSSAGHQPMILDGGRLRIVFNGEIYNYLELRAELEGFGCVFRTQTDTEVLMWAYEIWGEGCLDRLNGMWSFAIWDATRKALFCSVDRSGVKPFYYMQGPWGVAFASEIKALAELAECPRRADSARVALYLLSGVSQADDQTMFVGVRRVMPGHALLVRIGEPPRAWRWWQPKILSPIPSPQEAAGLFAELLRDSIRLRHRADVAVGISQSGGVDSSGLACLTAELRSSGDLSPPYSLRTYTATVDESALDEGPVAKQISDYCGAEWFSVKPSSEMLLSGDMERLVRQQDEPVSGLSIYMQYCVMRIVRQTGTVVLLSGQGPDELFAGYPWHYPLVWRDALAVRGVLSATKSVAECTRNSTVSLRGLLGYAALAWVPAVRQLRYRSRLKNHGLASYLSPETWRLYQETVGEADPNLQFRTEVERYGLPALCRFEDRNSMAFAVESRQPYLDMRLLDLAYSIPAWMKTEGGWSKGIARMGLNGHVPQDVLWKKRKIGFAPPGNHFFDATRRVSLDTVGLESSRTRGLVDATVLRRKLEDQTMDPQTCWRLLNLELWMRAFGLSPS